MKKKKRMKNTTAIAYGAGSMGKDLALGVIGSYLLIFYTDILGISATAAGIILVAAKIWDAINDPMMGAMVDRTNSRWGRFRPYILFVPAPLAFFSALCFLAPDWSYAGKVAYAAITYTITGMLFTAYDVPLWGMVPSITGSREESNKCISAARFFTSIGMFLAMTFAYPMIEKLGGGTAKEQLKAGYPRFMLVIGVMSVVFAWITFAVTKEQSHGEEQPSGNVFKGFLEVIKEKNVRILFITMTLHAVAMIVPNVIGTYYAIYYWGRPDMVAAYFAVISIAGLATAPITGLLLKNAAPKTLTLTALAICLCLSVAAFFVPSGSIAISLSLFGIFGLVMPVPMVTVTALLVAEGNQLYQKTGSRKDGVLFSLNSFAIKCGTALAGGLVSAVLAMTHYRADEMLQKQSVLTGIHLCRTVMIAAVYVLALVTVGQFQVKEEKQVG